MPSPSVTHIDSDFSPTKETSKKEYVFPGEHPEVVELREFIDDVKPILQEKEWSSLVRGKTPPSLLQYAEKDLTKIPVLVDGTDGSTPAMVAQRNQLRATWAIENERNADALQQKTDDKRAAFAVEIERWMRPKAGLRLSRLQAAHVKEYATPAEWHDGVAMWAEIVKLLDEAVPYDEVKIHENKVKAIVADRLSDGCHPQDYTDKVNTIIRDHNKYLAMKYDGANLSRLFLELLPDRVRPLRLVLERELETSVVAGKKMADSDYVLKQCELLVRKDRNPEAEASTSYGLVVYTGGKNSTAAAAKVDENGPSRRRRKAAAKSTASMLCKMLPEGKKCKSGTCPYDHDVTKPGAPCFRDPRVGGAFLPKGMSDQNITRIKQARADNAKRLGVKCEPCARQGEAVPAAAAFSVQSVQAPLVESGECDLWSYDSAQYMFAAEDSALIEEESRGIS